MADYSRAAELVDPPGGAVVIDYSGGDQIITVPARAVFIEAATTNLKVDMLDGTTVTWTNLPVGITVMRITKIYQTGSSAAGLILY